MPNVLHFDDAIDLCGSESKSVLLGNGFSIDQNKRAFEYRALLEKCALPAESPIRKVFETLQTKDFEAVVKALEHSAAIADAYGNEAHAKQFREDAEAARDALIRAVHSVHPDGSFDIPEIEKTACGSFLDNFNLIFTINYDLLLYWAALHACENHTDGFGTGKRVNGFRTFSETANCSTFYIHGALHLFLGEQTETRKRVLTSGTIIREISETIKERNQLPLFVAEGTAAQKMTRINSVPYLRHCYDQLKSIDGNIFIFGHSASEQDRHIYDAIFQSGVERVFFCVHEPQKGYEEIEERLAPFIARRKTIDVIFVDSQTANVWGKQQ
ncbi:DUF4917 family protein [Microvirga flavescens]|uniref:DUF4917 family protein n=1 Tax=Microvirga flavescens TaxID=2249811 RepID=UPI000DD682E2|nr:DUF4917 family protein [Microvirga flavescens]